MIHHIRLLKNLRRMRSLIGIRKKGIQKLENLSLDNLFIGTLSLIRRMPRLLKREALILNLLPIIRLALDRNRRRTLILIKSLTMWIAWKHLKVFSAWLRLSMLLSKTYNFINTHILDMLRLLLNTLPVHSWVHMILISLKLLLRHYSVNVIITSWPTPISLLI